MSFLPNNEQNQQAPQGQTTPNPIGAGAAPPQSGGSTGTGATGTSKSGIGSATGSPTQFGSSASKLGDYLTANAPQIGAQSQNVVNQLNSQYGQVQGDITNAANQFNQSVQGGYAAPNQQLVDQAMANPTQFAQTPENVSAFQAQYNNAYTGPQNYEGTSPYSNIQSEVSNAVQNAGLLNTQAGLQSYLGQNQGGNATRASNTLDALLLQGNPESQANIQNATNQFQGLTGQFGNTVTAADQSVAAAQQAAQQARDYAQQQAGQTAGQFNTGLQNAVATNEAARNTYNTGLAANQAAANTGLQNLLNTQQTDYAPALAQWSRQLSTSPWWGQERAVMQGNFNTNSDMYNAILNQQMNNNPATLANTTTLPQYQEAAALQQLLGGNYTSPLDQSLIGQAGTYQTPGAGLSLDMANQNAQNQISRLNDLSTLYSAPASLAYSGVGMFPDVGNGGVVSPQREAQKILESEQQQGFNQAYNPTQAFNEALTRLAANNYMQTAPTN
jgi:hypothetical protein